ncbi:MAG: hypothetical protein AB7S38_36165 [Vulcanimicrobiota bacterium]
MLIDPNRIGRGASPERTRSQPMVRKEPQSPELRDMVANIDNPPGETRMVVGDDGLLTLDSGGKIMASRENPAPAEQPHRGLSMLSYGLGFSMAGMWSAVGMMPLGFGMQFPMMYPLGLGLPTSFPPPDTIGETPPEPDRPRAREGSDMAEMVERLRSPQPERQIMVADNGLLTMMEDPYRPS